MSTEDEFTRYRELYADLQKRVERLSLYHHLDEEVRARLAELSEQMEAFPGLEEFSAELDALGGETPVVHVERTCPMCGDPFLSHLDELLCQSCRDPD